VDERLHSMSHVEEKSNYEITPKAPLQVQTPWGAEGSFSSYFRINWRSRNHIEQSKSEAGVEVGPDDEHVNVTTTLVTIKWQ
jgi:hypothetical protein